MKNGLPKFLFLADPYNSLEGRILILKTEYPGCIYELNRPDESDSTIVDLYGKSYSIRVHPGWNMTFSGLNMTQCEEVIRWYHHSQSSEAGPETDL